MVIGSKEGKMTAILCEDCKNFKFALDAEIGKAVHGYCRAWEYPFLQAIFKKEVPGAFMPPTECKLYAKGKAKLG